MTAISKTLRWTVATLIALSVAQTALAGNLHKEARRGDVDAVAELIAAGEDLNELDGVVGSALHWAAARGHVDVAVLLLDAGASVDIGNGPPDQLTPLHLAASSGHLEMVGLLLDHGASLNVGSVAAGTPLHHAGDTEAMTALFEELGLPVSK